MASSVILVTACGAKKRGCESPAHLLYRSPRIRALKRLVDTHPFAILSSRYGLVNSETVIAPYEQVMTKKRSDELSPRVAVQLSRYDIVVYFRGGGREEYVECIRNACAMAAVPLVICGFANMGDIKKVPTILQMASASRCDELHSMRRVSVILPLTSQKPSKSSPTLAP